MTELKRLYNYLKKNNKKKDKKSSKKDKTGDIIMTTNNNDNTYLDCQSELEEEEYFA